MKDWNFAISVGRCENETFCPNKLIFCMQKYHTDLIQIWRSKEFSKTPPAKLRNKRSVTYQLQLNARYYQGKYFDNVLLKPISTNVGLIKAVHSSLFFSWDRRCRSLRSTGRHLGVLMRGKRGGLPFHHVRLSSVSLASRDQDSCPSNSTINMYDLTKK